MKKKELHGSLQERPLSFLLFDLWTHERDGQLVLKNALQKKSLNFIEGKISLDQETLDEDGVRQFLSDMGSVNQGLLEQSASLAKDQKISWIKACIQKEVLTPGELWIQIRNYSLSDLVPWFDTAEASYSFDPSHQVDKTKIYCRLSTLETILGGTRFMQNYALIQAHLPEQDSDLLALFPPYLTQLELLPHEEYLFQLLSLLQGTKELYEKSELGLETTQKTLFIFLSLGLFSLPMSKTDSASDQCLLPGEVDRILNSFNKKCVYIFKYIGKEIGPVSMNILEKALEEAKSRLPHLFQNAKLLPSGRIDMNSSLQACGRLTSAPSQRELLNGLNEILMAEVLAVKKILGEEHESLLIKNLKKMET